MHDDDFEDSPPNEKPDTIPPLAPIRTDTEPSPSGEDPALVAIHAVHREVQNLAILVDSFKHQIEHAVDMARASCSASVMTSDTMKAMRRDMTQEHVTVMGALDQMKRTFAQAIISVSTTVQDQGQVLHEHQRRIDELDSEGSHEVANGNGTGHG